MRILASMVISCLLAVLASSIIIAANRSNAKKANVGDAIKVREYIKELIHS